MKKLIVLSLALLIWEQVLSQDIVDVTKQTKHKTFWGSIEVGRAFGLATKGGGYTLKRSKDFVMSSHLLRAKLGYYLTPQLSLGAGIGLTGHHDPSINTMPLVLDVRYHFLRSVPLLFAYMEAGKSLAPNSAFMSGGVGNLGLAYRLKVGKRTYFNPSIGYDLFTYRSLYVDFNDPSSDMAWNFARHSLFIKVGIEF